MSFIFTIPPTMSPRKEKVSDWAGSTSKKCKSYHTQPLQTKDEDNWKDVHTNIKQMDQVYDATFYAWLKSEENVLVTSIYLHRIANEYPLERIINALEWLTNDWRWESTSILIRHMTVDWCDEEGDLKRACLLKQLTSQWATHYIATLISTILISSPYNSAAQKRERFLKEFTKDWDFSQLSEFFMFLKSRANIDYKFKCVLLQEAARRDVLVSTNKSEISVPISPASTQQHHRRTSSNDLQDMKRSLLEEKATEESFINRCYTQSGSSSSSTTTTTSPSRYHHHPSTTRLSTSSSTLTMTVAPSSSTSTTTTDNLILSPSSSTSNNNSDKKRITVI